MKREEAHKQAIKQGEAKEYTVIVALEEGDLDVMTNLTKDSATRAIKDSVARFVRDLGGDAADYIEGIRVLRNGEFVNFTINQNPVVVVD